MLYKGIEVDEVTVALHLSNFTEEGWNQVKLTLEEFKELYSKD